MTLGSQSDLMSNNPTTNNQWWRHMLNHKHFVMRPSSWQLPLTKMCGCRTVHTGSQGESAESGRGLLHGNSKAFLKASCREQYHSYLERKKRLTRHRKSFVMNHVRHLICSIQNTPRQPASSLTPHEANRSETGIISLPSGWKCNFCWWQHWSYSKSVAISNNVKLEFIYLCVRFERDIAAPQIMPHHS